MTSRSENEKPVSVSSLSHDQTTKIEVMITSIETRTRKTGEPYLAIGARDKTGELTVIVWQNFDALKQSLAAGNVITVDGRASEFKERMYFHADASAVTVVQNALPHKYLPADDVEPDELLDRIRTLITSVKSEELKLLLHEVFDESFSRQFVWVPAAKRNHHARIGGLARHTADVAELAEILAGAYDADVDLCLTGALLHDVGKVWSYDVAAGFERTEEELVLGHIHMGAVYISTCAQKAGASISTLRRVMHIVLSHHGTTEAGSPVTPKTKEAMIVHLADFVDSRMAAILEAQKKANGKLTEWIPMFEGRFLSQEED